MPELKKNSLSFPETLGQSVANVSPTLTPALAVAVVVGMAGTASWLVYVVATVALLVVGVNIAKLAKWMPSAGSFFIYVSRSLGPSFGLLAGWACVASTRGRITDWLPLSQSLNSDNKRVGLGQDAGSGACRSPLRLTPKAR